MWRREYLSLLTKLSADKTTFDAALSLKRQNIPNHLFKYRSFDKNKYGITSLISDSVWLSSPDEFNDPFDSNFDFTINELANAFMRKNMESLLDEMNTNVKFSEEEILKIQNTKNIFETFIMAIYDKDPKWHHLKRSEILKKTKELDDEALSISKERIIQRLKSGLKVCSLSSRKDSILMWSHYSDFHRGFCIAYDFKSLADTDERFILLHPVIYDKHMFNATQHVSLDSEKANALLPTFSAIHKAEEWEYEDEWRIVVQSATTFLNPLQMPLPKAVYLGAKIEKKK